MLTFNHFNFNVLNLEKSLAFYKEALNLTPAREKNAADFASTISTMSMSWVSRKAIRSSENHSLHADPPIKTYASEKSLKNL